MNDVAAHDREAYWHAIDWLTDAVHELPAGVLDGADGASASACEDMLADLDRFRELCERLGLDDHEAFIEQCRWHFEHYPHYLSRRRHITDYETYIIDRHGPRRVDPPPAAPEWLRRDAR